MAKSPKLYSPGDSPDENPAGPFVEIDTLGPWPVTIDAAHHQVHEGESFHAEFRGDNLAIGAAINVLLVAPAGTYPHTVVRFSGTTEFEAFMYSAPTTTANGTAVAALNRRTSSALAANTAVYHTPTVTAVGTLMESERVGSKEAKVGGDRANGQEWILSPGSYLLRCTSQAAGNYVRIAVDWYEEGLAYL